MQLCRVTGPDGQPRIGVITAGGVKVLRADAPTLSEILHGPGPKRRTERLAQEAVELEVSLEDALFLPPIERQEVWAAGVTYIRSKVARMEESEQAASFYDKVYAADRPELFFKANPHRTVGHGQPIRVRRDTRWTVPEPELTLVLTPDLHLVGYTVGNDMSARDIEGENPLYLPQAKCYNQCAGLGPAITFAEDLPDIKSAAITLSIMRGGAEVFAGETSPAQLNRTIPELLEWLGRDNSFPYGCFLMTGTGIVPPDDFTCHVGDVIAITIDGIGTLRNTCCQGG